MFENLPAPLARPTAVAQGLRWENDRECPSSECVASEIAVAIRYNQNPHAVMMLSPGDLKDFCLGFSLTEHIVEAPEELLRVRLRELSEGTQADLEITRERFRSLDRRQRFMTGRIGCGVCGAQTLMQAIRAPRRVGDNVRLSRDAIQSAVRALAQRQPLNQQTGSMHAAAWLDDQGLTTHVREDIGRHNALDKLVGALTRARVSLDSGAVLITSRASHEIVQKAAAVGIQVLCAVSAPTALAIKMAQESGVTLIAYARDHRHTVYAHGHRLVGRHGAAAAAA